ncbi:TetR family transcriptional regulator [Aeromicrobium sp. S22]|nr:TetR family transcriptional regulator [Aeromicrobium sp. S22]
MRRVNVNEPTRQDLPSSLAQEAIRRSLSRRQDAAENDVRRMIEVGRELLSEGSNPRVADIVGAADLSNDAFYRYFQSKEDFVAAVVEDGGHRLLAYVERKMAEHDRAGARLRAAVSAIMSQAGDAEIATATRNILASSIGRNQRATGARNRLEAAMSGLLRDPLIELGSADPDRDARSVAAMLMAQMENFLWDEHPPSEDDLEHVLTFIEKAVAPTR